MLGYFLNTTEKSNDHHQVDQSDYTNTDCSSDTESDYDIDNLLEYAGDNIIQKGENQWHIQITSNGLSLITKWALNRHIDEKIVKQIKDAYIEDITTKGRPHMLDPIHVSHYIDDTDRNIYEILDGQHRYKALYEIHFDEELKLNIFPVSLEIHRVKNEEEKMASCLIKLIVENRLIVHI
jgi:hypothetical protein